MAALPVILLAVVVLSLCVGQYPMRLADLWLAITQTGSLEAQTVLWQIRLPRIAAAMLCGAALSAAGATYQGMFRNPLVSPDILGVSAGAGLGAVCAIFGGLSMVWVQLAAFVGGLLTVGCVMLVARLARNNGQVLALVLSGIAVGAIAGSGVALLKILADPYAQLSTITFWLMGGLQGITAADLARTAPLVAIGLLPLVLLRWRMNVLSLGDEEAQALGMHVARTRLCFIAAATLITAVVVSISGIIGWVGLIVPHMARLWVGPNFSRLLPTTVCLGAIFLVLTDTLSRTIASIELPLGILTAFLGAPFFLALLMKGPART